MTTVQEINSTIISGQLTNDELESVISAIKFARSQQIRKNTGSMIKGTRVKFTDNRRGIQHRGEVVKVKQKFILVSTDTGALYNVPANMLTVE